MLAVFRRELNAYFSSAIGYVFLVVFYIVTAIPFAILMLSYSSDISVVYSWTFTVLMFIVPILTMRLFSEEKKAENRSGAFDGSCQFELNCYRKIFSRFLRFGNRYRSHSGVCDCVGVFATMDWALILGSLLGTLLMGAALISVGMFISSLTENQVVAAIGALICCMVLMMLNVVSSAVPAGFIRDLLNSVAFYNRYYPLTAGIFNAADLLYFISFIVVFNFLTMRVLEKRRWA